MSLGIITTFRKDTYVVRLETRAVAVVHARVRLGGEEGLPKDSYLVAPIDYDPTFMDSSGNRIERTRSRGRIRYSRRHA
jgi:hypothetical protein